MRVDSGAISGPETSFNFVRVQIIIVMKYKVNPWGIETAHQGVMREWGHEGSRCKNIDGSYKLGKTIVEGSRRKPTGNGAIGDRGSNK